MPVRITFSFYGDVQIDRTLAGLEFRGEDASPAWEWMGDDFTKSEARQFRSQGAYASGGWPPLSPQYARWKARHYPGKTILRRTDELFRSLTVGPAIRIIEPEFAVFGSEVDYGRYHQEGSGSLPRRRPVELTENRRREWVRALQRFLVTGRVTP